MSYALPMPTPAQPAAPSSGARLVATGGRPLPLRHAHLDAEAAGGLCRTILTQRFVNPHAEPLHVTYLLPLPSDGAVSGFSFTLGETRIVGEIDTKQQARERFEQALVEGRTAALVEQDRTSLFTQEVGNVPPGETIVCEIVIDQPLRWLEEGAWEWRFPTVVGPRYMSSPGVVPDASKVTVPVASEGTGAKSSLALRIGDATTGAIESSSHRVSATGGEVRFDSAKLDRDVVVRWPVAAPEPGVSLVGARPASERHEGTQYGLLTLVPPKVAAASRRRDLILLLDTSGSMSGRPLDQLKRVSLALIDSLGPEDRLELIEFGSRPERFRAEPLRATRDGKAAAREWVQKLRASGGTEMRSAVLEALSPLREDAQRQVVLMTDGYIGFEAEIVRTLLDELPADARLHTVGVGSAPNRSLTEAAARAGRGAELIVGLEEDAERAAERLLARTAAPIVTELSIEGARAIAPRQLPDLFAGCPALVSLAVEPGTEAIEVRGRGVDGPFEERVPVPALELGQGHGGVVARFGREHVEDLEMELTATHDSARIDRAIERAGLTFQIATRLTSWIAVTEEVTVKSAPRHETMPHELPDGVSAEGLGLRGPIAVGEEDRAFVAKLEQQVGRRLPADERERLELEAAKQRVAPLPQTRTGTLGGGELHRLMLEAMRGPAGGAAADEPVTLEESADDELAFGASDLRAASEPEPLPAPAPPAPPPAAPAPPPARRAGGPPAPQGSPPSLRRPASPRSPGQPPVQSAAPTGRVEPASAGPAVDAEEGRGAASGGEAPAPRERAARRRAAPEPLRQDAPARAPTAEAARSEAAPTAARKGAVKGRPWVILAIVVLLVVALLAGLTWWLTGASEAPAAPNAPASQEAPRGG